MAERDDLPEFFEESHEFCDTTTNFANAAADDIFSILEALENASDFNNNNNQAMTTTPLLMENSSANARGESNGDTFEFHKSSFIRAFQQDSHDDTHELNIEAASPNSKRQKLNSAASASAAASASQYSEQGQPRITHITVERNRRKQMNEHLSVLRSLMPCFYVKRGDQASIIGGVINYINELQQVLQSLEAKKQRKSFTDILSPRPVSSSPRPSPLSPHKPPLSPRLGLMPISPRTPQSSSPYNPMMHNVMQTGLINLNSPCLQSPKEISPCNSSTNSSVNDSINELVASSKSDAAEVEVKFCGPNLLLKTVSHRIPGQVVKIVSALEQLALEILQVNINKVDERMLNSFTIKIGIECQLSAEELAQQIQQTFCKL